MSWTVSPDSFEDRVMRAVDAMVADGVPDAEISSFVRQARDAQMHKLQAGVDKQKSKVAALNAQPDPMSLGEIAKAVPEAGAALADKFNNAFTLGGWRAAVDKLAPQEAANMREREKLLDNVPGKLAGSVMDVAGGGMGAPAQIYGRMAVPLAETVVNPVAQTIVRGGVGGGVPAIAQAAFEGAPAGEQLKRGAVGAALGEVTEAVPAAASWVTDKIRAAPGTVSSYLSAMARGEYKQPEMQQLPSGQAGSQRAAEIGLDRIVKRDQQLAEQASDAYQSKVRPQLQSPVDSNKVRERLLVGHGENIAPDTDARDPALRVGLPLREDVQTAYNRAFDKTPDNATVEGTLLRRQALQQEAAFGTPNPTPAQEANREVYRTYRQGVREASPTVAAADDAYAAFARTAQRRSDILFNTEENVIPSGGGSGAPGGRPVDLDPGLPHGPAAQLASNPGMRVSKERAATTTIGRVGDDNVPGLRAKRYLDELSAQDPEFAKALEFVAAKKAYEGTRFSLGSALPTSLSTSNFARQFIDQNGRAAAARLVEPMATGIASMGGGSKTPSGMTGQMNPELTLNHPILRAYAEQQRRDREMAKNLRRGGR